MSRVRMSELLEKARAFDPSKMKPRKTTWAPLQENAQIDEDGHQDVSSAIRQCKTTIEDAQDMLQKLQTMNPEDSLPSWWTNKLAVVSSSMNKMRDYLLVPSVSEEVELDEMKKVSVEFDKRNKTDMLKAKKDLEKKGHTVDVSGSMLTITAKRGADIGREIKDVMNFYNGAKRAKALESVENEAVSPAQQAAIAISKKERGEKPKKEEVKLDEAIKISHVLIDTADRNEVVSMASSEAQIKQSKNSAERPPMSIKDKNTLKIVKLKRPLGMKAADKLFGYPFKESAELDEAKSSTGYELYHKSFSDAMQHSYAFAKKKFGITVDPKEIDRKVATGPKKPSSGKTNSYRLVGTDGKKAIQVQVANLDNKRYELNMYKEEVDLEEGTEFDTMKAYASGISRILGSQGIEVPINELIDPADIDDDASSKDVALAAKNIILQLKKSVDMNGKKDVEFASGKQKVPAAIAQKALDVHSKMKPQDKMKFQTTIAKSYTGLLNAIKGK